MITSAEAQLGKNMAILAAITTVVSFFIGAILIGPGFSGFHPQWSPINNIVGFFQGIGHVFTIGLCMKLFGADDKPNLRIISSIVFIGATMQLVYSLAPTANSNSVFDPTLSASQVSAIAGTGNFVIFILYALWALTVVSSDGESLLPSWASMSARGAAFLIIVAQALSLFGLIPATLWAPIFILGGVVLWPIFVFGLSNAFGQKV